MAVLMQLKKEAAERQRKERWAKLSGLLLACCGRQAPGRSSGADKFWGPEACRASPLACCCSEAQLMVEVDSMSDDPSLDVSAGRCLSPCLACILPS